MGGYLLKGILIGLLFGMPIGAVGTMTFQRTLNYGYKAGLLTGLGSSAADCLYACVGAFGLTLISDFLLKYQTVINILGSILIFVMGLSLIIRKKKAEDPQEQQKQATGKAKMFVTSFAVGITNPAAILTFLFAFSYLGISGIMGWNNGILLVVGVFIGTYVWWGALTAAVSLIKRKTRNCSLNRANKVFGVILILFAAVVLAKTFFQS